MAVIHRPERDPGHDVVIIDVPECLLLEVRIKVLGELAISRPWLTECIEPVHRFILFKPQLRHGQRRKRCPQTVSGHPQRAAIPPARNEGPNVTPDVAESGEEPFMYPAARSAHELDVEIGHPITNVSFRTAKGQHQYVIIAREKRLGIPVVKKLDGRESYPASKALLD